MKAKKLNFKKESSKSSLNTGLDSAEPEKANRFKFNGIVRFNKKKRKKKKRTKFNKYLKIFALISIFLITFLSITSYFFVVAPALRMRDSVEIIRNESVSLLTELEDRNLSQIDGRFDTITAEFDQINKELDNYEFLKNWDITKGYYDNLQTVKTIVEKTDELTQKSLPMLKTTLAATGFTVDGVEIDDEESAFSLVLGNMEAYLELYDEVEPDIQNIIAEFSNLDPEYIPNVGGIDFESQLNRVQQLENDFPKTSERVTEFLAEVPSLLGSNEPADYLLLLQNETEMRASGGIITAYGNMTLENGEFNGELELTDIWDLENYVRSTLGINTGPPNFSFTESYPPHVSPFGTYQNIYGQNILMNQGCGATTMRVQDSGLYADLNWTMDIVSDYYDNANAFNSTGYPDYDYILILNFAFAENLLDLIQPVEIDGELLTADKLFQFIKNETDDPSLSSNDKERKSIIADIANVIKEKFLDLPIEDVPDLIDLLIGGFTARDIAISAPKDDNIQAYLDKYSMSGRTENDFQGDYFHFNEAQNCSLKLNKFVRNSVNKTININDDGSIIKDVNVNWVQDVVYQPEFEHQYAVTPNFSYRAWTRIFMPNGSEVLSSDGLSQSGYVGYFPQQYFDEVENKYVSDNIIQFDHRRLTESDPIVYHDLNVSYKLPGELNYNENGEYKLLLEKHPGKSWGEEYNLTFKFQGKEYKLENLVLDRDKVITFKNGVIAVDNYRNDLDWVQDLVGQIPFNELAENNDS